MTPLMTIDTLMESWATDSMIDRQNLDISSIRTANLHQKYLDQLTLHKVKIFALEKKYLELKGIKSRYYSGQMTKDELEQHGLMQYQYKAPMKSEMDRLLETDKDLLDIKDRIANYTYCFEYCEEVIKALRDRNYQIRAAIDFMRFQSGN